MLTLPPSREVLGELLDWGCEETEDSEETCPTGWDKAGNAAVHLEQVEKDIKTNDLSFV